MNKRITSVILLVTIMAFSRFAGAQQHNILLIIGDDIGLDSLHISNTSTNASYPPIPNIQTLAERGVLFSNGYAYPTCSPTRASILTGRYGYRTGVVSPDTAENFSTHEYTLPEVMADQTLGYSLASVGKWHLGGGNDGPNALGGWPYFAGSLGGGMPNYSSWTRVENGVASNSTQYATRANVEDAMGWIDTQGTNKWFLWVGFNAAHTALHKPPNMMHSYDYLSGTTMDISTNSRPYFEAMVEAMDFQISRLLNHIDTNETTIIFLGDNGTDQSVIQEPYTIAGRGKGSLYEGGTHVPFLICGADVVNGGRTNDSVVHCVDLFATILELAGGTPPAGADSRSLVPTIKDQTFQPLENCILMETDSLFGGTTSGRAIRDDQFKLIRIEGSSDLLFDMPADPLESTNLLAGSLTVDEQTAYDALSEKLTSWTNTPTVAEIPTNGYPIVDTGQLDYYDDVGGYTIAMPAPGDAFAGQDAHYTGRHPSYQDNGDGTATDIHTGLMWQQTPDLTNKITFADAFTEAAGLTLGGETDWRVPSLKELYSLIDFSGTTGQSESNAVPYIDTNTFDFVYGDTNTERYIDAQYWSATEYVHYTMDEKETVFGVNFADGRIKGYPKYKPGSGESVGSTMFVRYVRGNTDYGINAFIDNGDGTVTDHATGLMWQKGDSGTTNNWEQALAYAEGLVLVGYRDWRLPNAKELQSIVDYTRSPMTTGSAAIDTNVFDVTETESFYWTSTTHLDGAPQKLGNYAVYLSFGRALGWINSTLIDVHGAGAQRSDPKSGTPVLEDPGHGPQGDILRIYNYVRCVRGGVEGPQPDSDSDGLTDWYEYNYSTSITNMDPTADDDSDTVSNADENAAGTIPTLGTSLLRVTDLASSTNGVVVGWSSELDRTYRLSASTNLIDDAFTAVIASNLLSTPPRNTHTTVPVSASGQFYRIEVE
jgi:arylsulfatase A-like enzyme